MQLLIRAIITGFGYKIGAELGRYIVDRFRPERAESEARDDDEMPEGLPSEPPAAEADDENDELHDRRVLN